MTKLYVAYGSNMIVDQMRKRCPNARLVSREYLEGYNLECRDIYSGIYLNAYQDDATSIPIYVWEITESDEANLDEYEGYPDSYIKIDVETSLGVAMMYVMSDKVGEQGLPAIEYMSPIYDLYVEEGYSLELIHPFIVNPTTEA